MTQPGNSSQPVSQNLFINIHKHQHLFFLGKVGARGVLYYMSTTIIAVILGIILVTTIQPGKGAEPVKGNQIERNITTEDTLMDLVRNLFPPNIIQAQYIYQDSKVEKI